MEQLVWKKPSLCAADSPQCVEVAKTLEGVRVRNTNDISVELRFTAAEWSAFILGVRERGDHDYYPLVAGART